MYKLQQNVLNASTLFIHINSLTSWNHGHLRTQPRQAGEGEVRGEEGGFQVWHLRGSFAEKSPHGHRGFRGQAASSVSKVPRKPIETRLMCFTFSDMEQPDLPVYNVKAHSGIINTIDAIGGTQIDCGAPEIVTGSRDGAVKVWDIRQGQAPVVDMSPPPQMGDGVNQSSARRDCWAVAFGNTYNAEERIVAAGYDNGDLKIFDLRSLSVRWEATMKNGICGLEFDRRDIPMNKLAVTTLEGGLLVYDMRTQHPTKGFSYVEERNAGRSVGTNGVISGPKATVWIVRHLPQNRDIFLTGGGTG